MRYTKEQAEMLALLVLMGCAVIVLSFLYLVKPSFATIGKCKQELRKTEGEIAKLSKAPVALAKAKNEMNGLTDIIERGEAVMLSGFETDPPLYEVCVRAATKLNLKTKTAFGLQTTTGLLEFTAPGSDGRQVTGHYDEVLQTLDIHSADFFTFCRFLSAAEKANEGLRITHLGIESLPAESQGPEAGKIKAKVELSMLGIREGEPADPAAIDMSGSDDFDVAQARNPFGPPSGSLLSARDPMRGIKDLLGRIKVTGIWSDKLIIEVPESGSVTVRKDETFFLGGVNIKYVSGSAESFVFEATDYGKRFRLVTNWKGQVKTIIEEEPK